MIVNEAPAQLASVINLSLVVPGISSTTARRSSARRLNKVLFPTLGRPTRATIGFGMCLSQGWLVAAGEGVEVGVGVGAMMISTSTVDGTIDSTITLSENTSTWGSSW